MLKRDFGGNRSISVCDKNILSIIHLYSDEGLMLEMSANILFMAFTISTSTFTLIHCTLLFMVHFLSLLISIIMLTCSAFPGVVEICTLIGVLAFRADK